MPLTTPLPANLPENWTYGQIIAPTGQEVGLPASYGYNYLMNQVNNSQRAALELDSKKAELNMSNLDSPSTALYNLGSAVRPNLADNWDFTQPIYQRGSLGGKSVKTLDRWDGNGTGLTNIDVVGKCIYIEEQSLYQPVESWVAEQLIGQTITWSLLTKTGNLATLTYTLKGITNAQLFSDEVDGLTVGFSFYSGSNIYKLCRIDGTGWCQALKVEVGDTQTLARKREDGKWVLIEHSDRSAELLKCQRYFQVYSTEEIRPSNPLDCRPIMRVPEGGSLTQGTLLINDIVYYYNSSEL